jgi:hypothetical protein
VAALEALEAVAGSADAGDSDTAPPAERPEVILNKLATAIVDDDSSDFEPYEPPLVLLEGEKRPPRPHVDEYLGPTHFNSLPDEIVEVRGIV